MAFRIHALEAVHFAPLFALSDEALHEGGACRVTADESPGYPCRVSLADAEVGERLILTHFEHQPADSPYRASHAIFVREGAEQAVPGVDEVPESLASRLLSVRAFDARRFLLKGDVIDGRALGACVERLFADHRVDCLHVHNAGPGCYAARVTRA